MKGYEPTSNLSRSARRFCGVFTIVCCASYLYCYLCVFNTSAETPNFGLQRVPLDAQQTISKCKSLDTKPGPSPTFTEREESDRFQPGTRPILLHNATIWTGRVDGLEIIKGDIFLEKGIIRAVGKFDAEKYASLGVNVVDAQGSWVTPGIVDLHSHMGVDSAPALSGAADGNSFNGLVLPWLRSVDGLNTHDESYHLSAAGGVTTSLILPGSADAIGGQAFVIKLRPTKERSTTAMLLEPPFGLNGSEPDPSLPPRWRHMKHACGENPARVYSGTRMDTVWAVRQAYATARQIKESQDEYCAKALAGRWTDLGKFPENLQWEAMVDILRGKVKVQTHCYEAVDIDRFISISNEFKFPVAAFHHAHEAYLVPDVLRKGYEHPPAIAMFAAFSRYKREAYRHSIYAPKILADEGIKVVMKSDHAAINSRYLLHEAQQAHYRGLAGNIALASVTSNPAEVLGLDHRIGFIEKGYDADIVVWDSHPLTLGATPKQVYIDGIQQLHDPILLEKPGSAQVAPVVPLHDDEAVDAILYDGLPPLEVQESISGLIVFKNVSRFCAKHESGIWQVLDIPGTVVVDGGRIVCSGKCPDSALSSALEIDLKGGSISPALIAASTPIGLEHITMEPSTVDGAVFDPLTAAIPQLINGEIIKASDGLQFGSRDALLAYRAGVSAAITAPSTTGFVSGLSTFFSLGANHKLEKGAVLQDIAALHVTFTRGISVSVSTQVAALRRLLLGPVGVGAGASPVEKAFQNVGQGTLPLAVYVDNADIMATLLELKAEVESTTKKLLKMTFIGASEAHILADEIAAADVGVLLVPSRPHPYTWDQRRSLPGPPLSESLVAVLASRNITVGVGASGTSGMTELSAWAAQNIRFDAGWAAIASGGVISTEDAIAMASSNIEKLLGVKKHNEDLVVTAGGTILSFEAKVVGMISPRRSLVDLF